MADYYTEFSEFYSFPAERREEVKTLMENITKVPDDPEEGALDENGKLIIHSWDFHWEMIPAREGRKECNLWISSSDGGSIDHVINAVAKLQKALGDKRPWFITWASTCSSLRCEELGGGWAEIRNGKLTRYNDTFRERDKFKKRLDEYMEKEKTHDNRRSDKTC